MKNTLYLVLLSVLITGCAKHSTSVATTQKKSKSKKNISILNKTEKHSHNLKKLINKTKLCKDKEKIETMNRVGKQIAKVINDKSIRWKFTLVENDSINATCFPNGQIIMTSGVFKAAKNDAEIATILAHEMAHVISKHGKARINRSNILNGLEGAGAVIAGLINPLAIIPFIVTYEIGTKHAIVLPSIRIEEQEADALGLKLMKKANYDIDNAYNLWCNIKEVNKHKKNRKETTHLSYDKRIKQIKCEIDKIKHNDKIVSNSIKTRNN